MASPFAPATGKKADCDAAIYDMHCVPTWPSVYGVYGSSHTSDVTMTLQTLLHGHECLAAAEIAGYLPVACVELFAHNPAKLSHHGLVIYDQSGRRLCHVYDALLGGTVTERQLVKDIFSILEMPPGVFDEVDGSVFGIEPYHFVVSRELVVVDGASVGLSEWMVR